MPYWAKSQSARSRSVLSMFGSGSFWTREDSDRLRWKNRFPSTRSFISQAAHHLGFRVRDLGDQNRLFARSPDEICSVDQARKKAVDLHRSSDCGKNDEKTHPAIGLKSRHDRDASA